MESGWEHAKFAKQYQINTNCCDIFILRMNRWGACRFVKITTKCSRWMQSLFKRVLDIQLFSYLRQPDLTHFYPAAQITIRTHAWYKWCSTLILGRGHAILNHVVTVCPSGWICEQFLHHCPCLTLRVSCLVLLLSRQLIIAEAYRPGQSEHSGKKT